MQTVKQFSVRSVNKPGRLTAVLEALSKEKVDLAGLAVTDDRHTLRFVPASNDAQRAEAALQQAGVHFETHDVLLVELPKQTGAYVHLCQRLAASHLEMDYTYAGGSGVRGTLAAIVKVNNLAKAQKVLSESAASNGVATKKLPRRRPVHIR